ncbi:MAG TPA: glycosyltransferase family 9 protein, partial [Burkholderiaceae bacterium]|nr:glycosyltransferase family 9 protein [Burkholderiaceae bacterium]
MTRPSSIYVRLPNWIGDLCMSLPCLDMLIQTQLPVFACARPWARSLLKATPVAGFVDMNGSWLTDARHTRQHRRQHAHHDVTGLLLPDSFSSAMVFRLGGIPAAGYRDDGRSLLLKWPVAKPTQAMHAVESWFYLTRQALQHWELTPAE